MMYMHWLYCKLHILKVGVIECEVTIVGEDATGVDITIDTILVGITDVTVAVDIA